MNQKIIVGILVVLVIIAGVAVFWANSGKKEMAETENMTQEEENSPGSGSAAETTDVEVYVDGKLSKTVLVKDEMLYKLIEGIDYGEHLLELKIPKPGTQIFTFTFG